MAVGEGGRRVWRCWFDLKHVYLYFTMKHFTGLSTKESQRRPPLFAPRTDRLWGEGVEGGGGGANGGQRGRGRNCVTVHTYYLGT